MVFVLRPTKQNKSDVSEKRPYLRAPGDAIERRALPHNPPHFIGTSDAVFFITICCQPKGTNQLCHAEVAPVLFEAARFYQDRHQSYIYLLLLMPDHLHILARFGPDVGMQKTITSWKRYTAKTGGILWQRDFFDHRLRNNESFDEKASYIRQNPVRAKLTALAEEWPYQIELG